MRMVPEFLPPVDSQAAALTEAMTRLRVKSGRVDDRTRSLLREIALKGDSQQWREWAQGQVAKLTP